VRRFSVARGIPDKTLELIWFDFAILVYLIAIITDCYYIAMVKLRTTHMRAFVSDVLVCALLSLPTLADKLRITTVPPGATVQINGVLVGTTPYEQNIPGGYLHKTKTSLGSRLEHPMVARLTLARYAAKEIQLTEGPMS